MTKFVKAAVNSSKLKWPSWNYIHEFSKFKIKCDILDEDLGCFKDTYELKLIGNKNDIDTFLSYLKMKDFKLTTF